MGSQTLIVKDYLSTASSGTVTINADSTVQILAEEAHPLDRFDPQVCPTHLETVA